MSIEQLFVLCFNTPLLFDFPKTLDLYLKNDELFVVKSSRFPLLFINRHRLADVSE